ncbi:putative BSD domain-containing protein [Lupinus albus]|uniref:Putative BSD domain-containing protein n=1 Tax=Lupinus albus TaxID=3870 RepID=A0A6A4PQ14_LUPAL|nr:putative BSD domain-containing protein [Lupinus albus]
MSWLAHSLANSLRLDENDTVSDPQTTNYSDQPSSEEFEGHGVKEDLNEIKQTLTRQLWGMASFLVPPPPPPPPPGPSPGPSISNSNSIQSQSENEQVVVDAVVSNQIQNCYIDDQDQELEMEEWAIEHAVGITDEVLTFAINISMHPETWLDFPIQEEDDTHDFDMSDAQRDHAVAIERLAPRLAALRIELCPCHMSESYFWKVYFVLLHSRLHKQDAEILSTPQVMAARGAWMQELHKQTKPEVESFRISSAYSRDIAQHDDFAPSFSDHVYSNDMPHLSYGYETRIADNETEKHTVESSETRFIDKSVIEESPTGNKDIKCGHYSQIIIQDYDDDDEWPDEDSDLGGYSRTTLPMVDEEDISFSDLEDDDYDIKRVSSTTGSKLV